MTSSVVGGYLELILGPMFSGKTTRIIDIYNSQYAANKNIKVINYTGDTRYHDSMLSTHDKVMIPCVFANKIKDVCQSDNIHTYDIILINEGQFFPDLYESVCELVEIHKKHVYICGLDGDFKRDKFGKMLDLIPLCDKVTKLSAICVNCKRPAIFSKRLTKEEQQIVIGSNNYEPMCRECYHMTV
jgi:thymidine kinase